MEAREEKKSAGIVQNGSGKLRHWCGHRFLGIDELDVIGY
jgi:hypothetical protein